MRIYYLQKNHVDSEGIKYITAQVGKYDKLQANCCLQKTAQNKITS